MQVGLDPAALHVDEHHARRHRPGGRPPTSPPDRSRRARRPRSVLRCATRRASRVGRSGPRPAWRGRPVPPHRAPAGPARPCGSTSSLRRAVRRPGSATLPTSSSPVVPPTEVTHGDGWAAYLARPPFPAAATTTMSCSAAPSSARSTVSTVDGPPTERFRTSTPSLVARVDRGDQVGGGAAVVGGVGRRPARLVDRDPGLGSDAAVRTEPLAGHLHRDPGVAGRDRRHLGAVAAVVERRERGGAAHGVLAEAGHEPAGTDQLAVAVVGVPAVALDAHATEAAWPATQSGDLARTASSRARCRCRRGRPRRPRHRGRAAAARDQPRRPAPRSGHGPGSARSGRRGHRCPAPRPGQG